MLRYIVVIRESSPTHSIIAVLMLLLLMMMIYNMWIRFVSCVGCGRRQHQLCVKHLDQIWTLGYVCDECLQRNKRLQPPNPYVAESELVCVLVFILL